MNDRNGKEKTKEKKNERVCMPLEDASNQCGPPKRQHLLEKGYSVAKESTNTPEFQKNKTKAP